MELASAWVQKLVLGASIALSIANGYAAEPKAAAPRVTVWGPNVVEAEVVHRVSPDLQHLRPRLNGIATLEFWLNERGEVLRVEVVTRHPGPIEQAVVAAACAWKFMPASISGKPVRSVKRLTVSYSN